jgi:hypothetical protein
MNIQWIYFEVFANCFLSVICHSKKVEQMFFFIIVRRPDDENFGFRNVRWPLVSDLIHMEDFLAKFILIIVFFWKWRRYVVFNLVWFRNATQLEISLHLDGNCETLQVVRFVTFGLGIARLGQNSEFVSGQRFL